METTCKSHKELLTHYFITRKDVSVKVIFNLLFKMYDLNTKKDFRILSNLMYKEDIYREQKKFLLKCRFYNLHPKHIDFITQQTKDNHTFSYNCQLNQNNLIKKFKKNS